MAEFEVSSAFVDSIVRGLRKTEHFEAIMAALGPEAAKLVNESWSAPWQPGRFYVELGAAAVQVLGEGPFEALSYAAVKDRFGPIVLPMLTSTLAKTNRSPAAVLSKLNELVKVAMRGLDILWEPAAENGGVLQIRYPLPVGAHLGTSWRGVVRFIFEVTRPGTIQAAHHTPDGKTLQYRLAW